MYDARANIGSSIKHPKVLSILLGDKKMQFFPAAVVLVQLYGCTTWTLVKLMIAITQECYKLYWRSLEGSTPQNSSCTATYHPLRKLSKLDKPDKQDKFISDIMLWTPSHERAKVGRPGKTYIQQLCADTGCNLEDLLGDFLGAMNDREDWCDRVREIRASSAI